MIFVDTGAWYALFVATNRDHLSAEPWFEHNTQPLITTDYVVDEVLTLLRVRRHPQPALLAGETLFEEDIARNAWVSPVDIDRGWGYFREYEDKRWSFTDCVSRAVIERLGIRQAFAFDKHFRQFGTLKVLP